MKFQNSNRKRDEKNNILQYKGGSDIGENRFLMKKYNYLKIL